VRQAYEVFDKAALGHISGAAEGWRTTLDRLQTEVAAIAQAAAPNPVTHGAFTLERTYPVSPSRLFSAFTDLEAKARWFGGDFETLERHMDVRPGGRERLSARWPSGLVSTFDAIYFDVVPDQRLVYAYEMHLDDHKISVSLATLTLTPSDGGVRLTVTEQGAFLNGYEDGGSREHGTGGLLDRLGASLLG